LSQNMFDELGISYEMVEGICYINGENLISHLKKAVSIGIDEITHLVSSGQFNAADYAVASASLTGLAGVGMWIEEGVIEVTQEKFREALDKEWPSL